jgi:hypothetical protein
VPPTVFEIPYPSSLPFPPMPITVELRGANLAMGCNWRPENATQVCATTIAGNRRRT